MAIRINTGWCRGLTLKNPPTLHTRPTASRIRESAWNSLQFDLQDSIVLDLFGGSGAVGIEAISRGARELALVDNSQEAVRCLNYNVKQVYKRSLGRSIQPKLSVWCEDATNFLSKQKPSKFDIIWIDPPYSQVNYLCAELARLAYNCLVPGGKVIFEYDEYGFETIEQIRKSSIWHDKRHKRYGKIYITILEKLESSHE